VLHAVSRKREILKNQDLTMKHFLWVTLQRLLNPSCTIHAAGICRHVKLGRGVTVGRIGKYTYINKYCLIDRNTASIGNFCSIAYGVKIGLGNHPVSWVSTHPFAFDSKYGFVKNSKNFEGQVLDPCVIGHDVWIGANAVILAGVKIGNGAIIGANSLVNKDVEPYSIVAGSPARHIRYRFDEKTIAALQQTAWWEWEDAKIRSRIQEFDNTEAIIRNMGDRANG
jgi:acetyltransferase-like isoleucine patch superfamily enzyme